MGKQAAEAVGELELLIGRLVDNYVMAVTESLCSMENDNPGVMQQSGLVAQRAQILARLDALDELAAGLRDCSPRAGDAGSGPTGRLATRQPQGSGAAP